ncbi:hypothetical protein [Streptomyces sp. C]|uniref:hypothetical protein n=1 Tax=Streptomyces sp. C TaxID=253839 RepID=UPI0001DEF7B1|nr:hypothetical protein [Streptomyces sp. C]EFL19309.1 predicted protein [Streptomyces sp. C]
MARHHGSTGTSRYLAPTAGRYLAICTNAVLPRRSPPPDRPLRAPALKTTTT